MRKFMVIVLALVFVISAQAQVKVYDNFQLFATSICSTGGINSTWVGGKTATGRSISNTITFTVNNQKVDRAWLECTLVDTTSGWTSDSMAVYMQGIGPAGDTTAAFLDTLIFEWGSQTPALNTSAILQITPWMEYCKSGVQAGIGDGDAFPYQARFFAAPFDSGADFAFPYAGLIADTIGVKFRLIVENVEGWGVGGP